MNLDVMQAALAIKNGNLVAFPTETVFGLGADAENKEAVGRIYAVKGRPTSHPLIIHLASIEEVKHFADHVPDYGLALAREYWPGPLTLIFSRTSNATDFVTGDQNSVGLRVPSHPVALELLRNFRDLGGKGIAAPSANRFGRVSPTTSQEVEQELGDYLSPEDLILQGDKSNVGIESTIVDCLGERPRILRPGSITAEMIEQTTGLELDLGAATVRVSGSLESHYAPSAKVLLDEVPVSGSGFIATANHSTPEGVIRLAAPRNDEEYARVLYSALRAADDLNLESLYVWQPLGEGIAIAVRDRLARASRGSR